MGSPGGYIKSLIKGSLGLAGIRLIDPLEVFYIKEHDIVIPIISKSACTTIKEGLIDFYKPGFRSKFPQIHKVDPSMETDGKVERIFFHKISAFHDFARSRKVYLVLRNPAGRLISCYKDVATGKNTMYEHPSGLSNWIKFQENISFKEFAQRVYRTSDHLSDRHFRSQTFGLDRNFIKELSDFRVYSIKGFLSSTDLFSENYKAEERVLNKAAQGSFDIPDVNELRKAERFRKRYTLDLELCDEYGI